MAINLATDIVLGVSRAADPEKLKAAAARLRQLSEAAAAAPPATVQSESLSAADLGQGFSEPPTAPVDTTTRTTTTAATGRLPKPAASATGAFHQLEAYVLQTFVQAMMPKHAETFFGKGTAGEVWKSMLSEKLGAQLAQSGKVGLAERLAAGLPAASKDPVAAAEAVPMKRPAVLEMLPYLASPISEKRS